MLADLEALRACDAAAKALIQNTSAFFNVSPFETERRSNFGGNDETSRYIILINFD
jgi:hypothetical protein